MTSDKERHINPCTLFVSVKHMMLICYLCIFRHDNRVDLEALCEVDKDK